MRRGGRIGAAQSLIGGLLGLRPMLTFADGRAEPVAKSRGREDAYRKMVDYLSDKLALGVFFTNWFATMTH